MTVDARATSFSGRGSTALRTLRRVLALASGCTIALVSGQGLAQDVFDGCGLRGDGKLAGVADLDQLKNRFVAPEHINSEVTLSATLAPGDDSTRWSQDMAGTVEGYVGEVYVGGIETANCHAKDAQHRDTHIAIALSPSAATKPETMIVEVTPRWRAMMASRGADWSTKILQATILHHRVRVTG